MAEFKWFPDADSQKQVEPRALTAKFGDGYEETTGDGLNTILEKWSLTFTRSKTEIADIENFLRARGGVESFLWRTPEGARAGYFKCRSWSSARRLAGAMVVLTCSFEEVP